jgi:hypothetical protein
MWRLYPSRILHTDQEGHDMTTVTIKLSQDVVDKQHTLQTNSLVQNPIFNSLYTGLKEASHDAPRAPVSSATYFAGTLRMDETDGAIETYFGIALASPDATQGSATAGAYDYYKPGVMRVSGEGLLNYDYQLLSSAGGNVLFLSPSAKGSIYTTLNFATLLKPDNAAYDPIFGNIALSAKGKLSVPAAGMPVGAFSRIEATADKFLKSAVADGNFTVLDWSHMGDGATASVVTGTLKSYTEEYVDGSKVAIAGAPQEVNFLEVGSLPGILGSFQFGSNDVFDIDLPSHLYSTFMVWSGAGDDQVSVRGGSGQVAVTAGEGNDTVTLGPGGYRVDGGAGIDLLKLSLAHTDYTVTGLVAPAPDARFQDYRYYNLTDKSGNLIQVQGLERVAFADQTIALDIDGHGGAAYRLYQAAFNRTPDLGGLGYWIDVLDRGANLTSVAEGFVDSKEFHDAYRVGLSNRDLVTQFYHNILHRDPDAGGLDFWTGILDRKVASVGYVLGQISESPENYAALIGVIGNGFAFTPVSHG